MKYLFLGLALLALLILACCWSTQTVAARTEGVLLPLGKALQADAAGMPQDRNAWIETAAGRWRDSLPLLACLVSHGYTAEISDGLTELQLLPDAEFRRSCLVLRERLIRLREMDLPTPGNIF